MKRKISILLAALAVILPCQMIPAASVTFTNFSYTTTPYTELLKQVASKTKADNEQNWYATLTGSNGLGSAGSTTRALLTSNTTNNSLELRSALVPINSSTTSIKQEYFTYTGKGSACKLYVTGDGNNGGTYSIKISGRYTS